MAGDWIKVEKATSRKPEILHIAELLDIHPDHAFGICIRFWSWCDDHLSDCHARSVTKKGLNAVLGVTGFAEAIIKAGWLDEKSVGLDIPNFDRHLSQSAKTRALAKNRKDEERSRKRHDESVTKTRLEKRREESMESESIGAESKPLCTIAQAREMGQSYGLTPDECEFWWHTRNSSGWTKGSANGGAVRKITSCQSDMATAPSWIREMMANAKNPKINGKSTSTHQAAKKQTLENEGLTLKIANR